MKILVLCKRHYTGKDLLSDRYGRLYELPKALASMGHRVTSLALSYRLGDRFNDSDPPRNGVEWLAGYALPWPPAYLRELNAVVTRLAPDVIWASSDALHAIVADHVSMRFGLPLVIDLYDDYEAFGLTRLPGLTAAYRRACARASALTVVTHTLGDIVTSRLGGRVHAHVIGNGIAHRCFEARPKLEARARFGLPRDDVLVGSTGALDASRGVEDLVRAFQLLKRDRTNARLVVAGPRDRTFRTKGIEGMIDLGILPHEEVPWLISALDVGVVCNRDSLFGRACYPMKLVEMMACGLPVVAAAVGDVPRILAHREQCLYPPGDSAQLMRQILSQIMHPVRPDPGSVATWDQLGRVLSTVLENVVENRSRQQ